MYLIQVKCVCPQIHRFEGTIKKKRKSIMSIAGELVNKNLVGTKASIFCPECRQVTVIIVEDVLEITKEGK